MQSAGGKICIDTETLPGKPLPKEYYQVLATAIMHFESSSRPIFCIKVDESTYERLGLNGRRRNRHYVGLIERKLPVEEHERWAEYFVNTANQIYQEHLKVNLDKKT